MANRDELDDPTVPAWVDGVLRPVGKRRVHLDGLRHMAVSVFVVDDGDVTTGAPRLLLQRRALSKYHTPGLWANACCTHPKWGEDPGACAVRRLREELGVTGLDLSRMSKVEYRADVGGGMTEHEVVDIFVARAGPDLPIAPDPDEVAGTRWMALPDLDTEIAAEPDRFAPWLRIYLSEHRSAILRG